MARYDLYIAVEAGRTVARVPRLLGCVVVGPTDEAVIDAAPEMIRAYGRFLARVGHPFDPDDGLELRVFDAGASGCLPLHAARDARDHCPGQPSLASENGHDPVVTDAVARARALLAELSGWFGTTGARRGADERRVAGLLEGIDALIPGLVPFTPAGTGLPERLDGLAAGLGRWASWPPAGVTSLGTGHRRRVARRVAESCWEVFADLSRRPGGPPR